MKDLMLQRNGNKIFKVIIASLLFLFLFSSPVLGANYNYKINYYNIYVDIPDSYDRFNVTALLELEKLKHGSNKNPEIIICKYFNGVKVGNIRVYSFQEQELCTVKSGDRIVIKIPDNIMKKDRFVLRINYVIKKGKEHRNDPYADFAFKISKELCHINASITRTDNWFPKLAGTFMARVHRFKLSVETSKDMEVMASGKLRKIVNKGKRKVYIMENYHGISHRSLYFFASRMKRVVKKFPDGFRVIMIIPGNSCNRNTDKISKTIHDSYRYFENTYGKIPGNEYKILAFPYGYAGLFNSMCVPVSLFTRRIEDNKICFPSRILIHEVSHTWWGNGVSSNPEENYWLYEGFAKYSEITGIKTVLGADVERESFSRLKLATLPYIGKEPAIIDAGKCRNRNLQIAAAYYKGAIFLRLLESVIGRKNFMRGMRDYVRINRGESISTDDFRRIMQNHSKVDLKELFQDYVEKPGFARYSIKKVNVFKSDNKYIHKFEVRNTGDKKIYTDYSCTSTLGKQRGELIIAKNDSAFIDIISPNEDGKDVEIKLDPDNVFPIIPEKLQGCGGVVYINKSNKIKFYGVLKDSPLAKSGVRDGMTLLGVNGKKVSGKDMIELNYMLSQPPGTKLKLKVGSYGDSFEEVIISY